jgi:(p)ppGpp synthase/HD superfamily hydrolase
MIKMTNIDKANILIDTHLEVYSKDAQHAYRVAQYVADNLRVPYNLLHDSIAVALCHDLLEDGFVEEEELKETFADSPRVFNAIKILTKSKDISYDEYCMKIGSRGRSEENDIAYWVKIADMKDHLMQTETLTDRLKEKYLSGLRYLL